MTNIEGFVSVGTGGLLNSPVAISSGVGNLAGSRGGSGTYWGALPGYNATAIGTGAVGSGTVVAPGTTPGAGAPTGWQGTFSGAIGLYGAGVDGIARCGVGYYAVQLSDDWVRLDSCQVQFALGQASGLYPSTYTGVTTGMGTGVGTGVLNICPEVVGNTIGLGNSQTTGGIGSLGLKNQIFIQFTNAAGPVELPLSSGFYIQLRLRDSFAGPQ